MSMGNSPDTNYGNYGYIYVNTSDVINGLHDALYRSLWIFYDSIDWVEIGWGAGPHNITSQSNPTVFAYWVNSAIEG